MQQGTKKKILIGIAVAGGAFLLGAVLWYFIFTSQFISYHDTTYGFDIKYPAKWQMMRTPQAGAAVVFLSPKETALDVFRENVNITVGDVPAEIATLKNFSDKIILQMTRVFKNVKVMEYKPILFGGRKGTRFVFTAQKPDAVTIFIALTIKGAAKSYILTYMAATKNYQKYLPLVEFMVQSFKLNP